MADVIKEFLVAIGYKDDEAGHRRFNDAIEKTTKGVLGLGLGVEAALVGLYAYLNKAAEGFEKLGYQARLVGSSAEHIRQAGYAASQTGSSVATLNQTLASFSSWLKLSGGGSERLLESYGVHTKDINGNLRESIDLAEEFDAALKKRYPGGYGTPGYGTVRHFEDAAGIPEESSLSFGDADYQQRRAEQKKRDSVFGLDDPAVIENARKFEQEIRRLKADVDALGSTFSATLWKEFGIDLKSFGDYLEQHHEEINLTLVGWARSIKLFADGLLAVAKPIAEFIGNTIGWKTTGEIFAGVVLLKLVAPLDILILRLAALTGWKLPLWLAAMLGAPGLAVGAGVGLALAARDSVAASDVEGTGNEEHLKNNETIAGHAGRWLKNKATGAWEWIKGNLGMGAGADESLSRNRHLRRGHAGQPLPGGGVGTDSPASAAGDGAPQTGEYKGGILGLRAAAGLHPHTQTAPAAPSGGTQLPQLNRSGVPTGNTAVWKGLSPEARGLLDALSGPESGGSYNKLFGGGHFSDYSHHPGHAGQGRATDSGRYQFTQTTWRDVNRSLHLPDFSPESQDKAAWYLAQRDYRHATGRDLQGDLKSGNFNPAGLAGTWVSIAKDHNWRRKYFDPNMRRAQNPPVMPSEEGRSSVPSGTLKPNMTRAEIDAWNAAHKNPLAPPAGARSSPYGTLDPDAIRRSFGIQQPNFKVPPLGHQSSWHRSTNNQVAMNQKTEIHVHGVDNPQEAAQRVGRHQTRVNSDLLKNTMGAIG